MKNLVKIFDTTLRDGQQCPGAGMSFEHNMQYAHMAAELGIDVLEAGFPSASKLDFDMVNSIAKELAPKKNHMIIAGLCQLREEQIDKTIEALLPAVPYKKARLHTYLPVDPDLLQASLGGKAEDKKTLLQNIYNFIKKAVDVEIEVEFSPEGYTKMGGNFDFTTECIRAAIQAGATTINCPDTIGGAHRFQGEDYFVNHMNIHASIMEKQFPGRDITWSTHCHNDFGTAVENTINSVFDGPVRQIEVTMNGMGERAGNAALEQCVMIIKHFAKLRDPKNPLYTNIQTEKLQEVSNFVAQHMLPRQPHWPITGENAARHTSGGHTNAILKNPLVYQPFNPEEVGNSISFVFGPLSGGNHAQDVIQKAGYECKDEEKAEIAQFIKDYYKDRRKGITDKELINAYLMYSAPIQGDTITYSRTIDSAEVTLHGRFFGKKGEHKGSSKGKDSPLAALKNLIDTKFKGLLIQSHKSISESEGIDARSISTILITDNEQNVFQGEGIDEDIEISAMKALIDAMNKAYIEKIVKKK